MDRRLSAKKAWARLRERAECGEKFGFMACIALLYKAGHLTTRAGRRQIERVAHHSRGSGQVSRALDLTGALLIVTLVA